MTLVYQIFGNPCIIVIHTPTPTFAYGFSNSMCVERVLVLSLKKKHERMMAIQELSKSKCGGTPSDTTFPLFFP